MSDLPPLPDPVKVQQWEGQIRAVLTLLGGTLTGLGIVLPSFTDAQLSPDINAAMIVTGLASYLAGAIWSWRQKTSARATTVASASASAQLGRPVVVTVTPAGQPNVLTAVSATEVAAAPSAPLNVEPSPPPKAA